MLKKERLILVLISILTAQTGWAKSVDHSDWDQLLKTHVIPINGGQASSLDYQGVADNHNTLKRYLSGLSKVSQEEFDDWDKNEQLAFLINAYNAWTVELILSAWPDIKSIKELGGFLRSPWDKKFIPLLGKDRSLNDIEHSLIRGSDRYNEPRIHFAVNCASIGCPALRTDAYVGSHLDTQLEEQTQRFLSDQNRNRVEGQEIKLSAIFKWYREDFERGWQGYQRLEDFLIDYAAELGLSPKMVSKLKTGDVDITFLDYDWRLNQVP